MLQIVLFGINFIGIGIGTVSTSQVIHQYGCVHSKQFLIHTYIYKISTLSHEVFDNMVEYCSFMANRHAISSILPCTKFSKIFTCLWYNICKQHTYIHIFSFFQFHTARLLAKYRTRQKHQSYARAKQLLQVNSTNPHITQSTPQPKYSTIFTLHHNILKEI